MLFDSSSLLSGASLIEGVVVFMFEKVKPATLLSEAVSTAGVMVVSLHDGRFGILAGMR